MRYGRRLRTLERSVPAMFSRWLETLTEAELDELLARCAPSELAGEIETWTLEQCEACLRGVPLETVRAMGGPSEH